MGTQQVNPWGYIQGQASLYGVLAPSPEAAAHLESNHDLQTMLPLTHKLT